MLFKTFAALWLGSAMPRWTLAVCLLGAEIWEQWSGRAHTISGASMILVTPKGVPLPASCHASATRESL